MSDKKKKKNSETRKEWSFDFGDVGDSIGKFLGSIAGDEEVQHSHFKAEKGDTASARVEIHFSVGENNLRALSGGGNLIEADLTHIGDIDFEVMGDDHKRIKLHQVMSKDVSAPFKQGLRALSDSEKLVWNVALAPGVAFDLDVQGGVGASNLDLSALDLTGLDVQGGVGVVNLTLPAISERIRIDVQAGVGAIRVNIPEGCNADIKIQGGVGSVDVTLPAAAPVRLKGNTGLGGIKVPSHFDRVKGKSDFMDNSGVWETANYGAGADGILLKYEGGVGGLRVRTPKVV